MHTSIYFVILILYFCELWPFGTYNPNRRIPQYHDSVPSLDGRITIMYLSKSEIEDAYVFLFIRYNSYQIIYTEQKKKGIILVV